MALTARAPAKLNLCLHVGAMRADGLHEICSLVQSVTLADEVTIERSSTLSDELVCPDVGGPNLALQALVAFRERFGWDGPPQRITIEKRIPVAAGLGGGSADAAAVLRLAAAVSGIEPKAAELRALAMSLGADVPFQLEPGTAVVRGAGEQVEPVARPGELSILLLTSARQLGTADVYARADTIGLAARDLEELSSRLLAVLTDGADLPHALPGMLHNDLEPAALELEPSAGRALQLLRNSGARGASLSGSGPTAFGLYASTEDAEAARAALAPHWSGQTIAVGAAGSDYAALRPASTAS